MKGAEMKRIICVLLILCVLPVCAFSETLDMSVVLYNSMAEILGISELPKDYNTERQENGKERYTFDISDSLKCIFAVNNGNVEGCTVVCFYATEYVEFIAMCMSAAFAVAPDDSLSMYPGILFQFYDVRAGKEAKYGYYKNATYHVSSLGGERMAFIIAGD